MMWYWHPGHMGIGAGGWIGMAFMVLFWIAVVIGIVYLIRHLVRSADERRQAHDPSAWERRTPEHGGPSALNILEERYARGEIDQEDFLRRRADLTGLTR